MPRAMRGGTPSRPRVIHHIQHAGVAAPMRGVTFLAHELRLGAHNVLGGQRRGVFRIVQKFPRYVTVTRHHDGRISIVGSCDAGNRVLGCLDRHLPGVKASVQKVDIATPLTVWHSARAWRGAFEGRLPTSEAFKHVPKQLPRLDILRTT